MAKLVIISESLAGRTFEITAEKATVGRVDDNKICIVDASVSSHHCELQLKGDEIAVKDLNSTNGTFINGDPVKEAILKPGQTLRLGGIELRYETGKRQTDQPRTGVKIGEASGNVALDKNAAFGKKSNKVNKIFFIVGGVLAVLIIGLLVFALLSVGKGPGE